MTNSRSEGEACDHREKGEDVLRLKHNSTPTKSANERRWDEKVYRKKKKVFSQCEISDT